MTPEALDELRRNWFRLVSEAAFAESWTERFPALAVLPPISRLTVVMIVGVGHLLGLDDQDLAIDEVLTEVEVEDLIIRGWRTGSVGPDLAAWLFPSLLSARWAASRYEQLDASPVGRWLESSHFSARLSPLAASWNSPPDYAVRLTSASALAPGDLSLDDLYAWLVAAYGEMHVLRWFTPLETRLIGADPERDRDRAVLEVARSEIYVSLLMPGAWPNRARGETPAWFRDVVTIRGARFWRSSSGYVATLSVVVETDRDESSLLRWSYAPALGARFPDESSVEIFIVLDHEDDPAYLPFSFDYRYHQTVQQLDVMLTVGLVRVEFYRLDTDGRLRHLWNFGISFSSLSDVRAHRKAWAGTTRDRMDIVPTATELLQMIDQRQRALFESTLPTLDVRSSAAPVAAAWEWQLQVLDDAARTHARGGIVDERVLTEAASALRAAEVTVEHLLPELDDKRIGTGEALLHVSVKEDSGWFSSSVVYRTRDGVLHGSVSPLDAVDGRDLEADGPVSAALIRLLEPLRELTESGVTDLVISAGIGAYSLPFHDAALRMGFRTATYAHSLRLLHENREPAILDAALILGHPGEGKQYIAAAGAELRIVAALTGSQPVRTGWRTTWPGVVHIAGHGVAGRREHETGILLANNDFLSSPAILRDVDAEGTAIAFLSACSSGTGRFDVGRAAHAVPLDVALLEKGCRTVISTSAPVNDHVALIFATVFHHARSLGAGNWDAYLTARACFQTARPDVAEGLRDLLDEEFPQWRLPLPAAQYDDWMRFRFSGEA